MPVGRSFGVLVLTPVVVLAVLAEPALAQVSVSRAEVSGSRLRIEGTALGSRDITVDGVVLARSEAGGAFRIERDGYTAPADCTVDLNDGSGVTVATLSGCVVRSTPSDTTAPTAPTGLTASLSGNTATLRWTASTDAVGVTGYRITRNGAPSTTTAGTTYSDAGLAAGTWTYTVAAYDAAGNTSGPSGSASVTVPPPPADTAAPSAPTGLTATVSGSTVSLSWTASTDAVGVAGYRINRGATAAGTTSGTTYSDTGLAAGDYTYTVVAYDAAGNTSDPSATASATVPPSSTDTTRPSAPTALAATVSGSTVNLTWSASTDAVGVAGYRVSRGSTLLGTTTELRYSDAFLAPGTYTYTVTAYDAAGNTSLASNAATATVQAEGLTFLTPAQMQDATVGQAYLGYIVCSDPPGPSTFKFKLVSGRVPAGTRFEENTLPNRPEARVIGTPTATGTSTFTVEVRDGTGAVVRRTFSIRVVAG